MRHAQGASIPGGLLLEAGTAAPSTRAFAWANDRRALVTVARLGRFGVVWLPIFVVLTRHAMTPLAAVLLPSFAASVFAGAQRLATESVRPARGAIGQTASAAVGVAAGLLVLSALAHWIETVPLTTGDMGVLGSTSVMLVTGWDRLVGSTELGLRRVLVVGTARLAERLLLDLRASKRADYVVVGIVGSRGRNRSILGVPVLGTIDSLAEAVAETRPDLVVLPPVRLRGRALRQLLDAAAAGFRVVELPEFYEHVFGRVPVETVSPSWFMSVLHLYGRPYARATKRAFDIVVSVVGLVLTAPLWPLVALLVRRSPGPVLFRQARLGEGGRLFTIYKFRTMTEDAERDGAVWATTRDARVTREGAFLRRCRLDELPQLLNVLRGEMSIVGPRPERPEFLALLQREVPFWTHRHLVKPGITGWAQVRRGYTDDVNGTAEKLSYDLWYLRHRSLLVDAAICARTFGTLLSGSGAR